MGHPVISDDIYVTWEMAVRIMHLRYYNASRSDDFKNACDSGLGAPPIL